MELIKAYVNWWRFMFYIEYNSYCVIFSAASWTALHCSGILYRVKNHATRDLKLQYNQFSCKNMSVLSGPILIVYTKQFSRDFCLGHWQHWLGNVWNVVPEWLIQYFIGYFPHRHCLSAIDQHYTNNLFLTTCSDNID